MTPESPSFMDRLRAGMAWLLSGLAGGARRMEAWTSRGVRPILLGLVAIAILVAGALAVAHDGRILPGGHGPRHERSEMRPKPEGKPEGKPEIRSANRPGAPAKPDGRAVPRPEPKPAGKPEAPRPPEQPVPPQPPQ